LPNPVKAPTPQSQNIKNCLFPGVLCPRDFQGNFHSSEAVLQPNIWLKVLPKSLHQFRNCFQIKSFRRLTLPSGLWFPCCEICFRSTRWPLASPGTRQILSLSLSYPIIHRPQMLTHFQIVASVSPHYVNFLAEGAPKSRITAMRVP